MNIKLVRAYVKYLEVRTSFMISINWNIITYIVNHLLKMQIISLDEFNDIIDIGIKINFKTGLKNKIDLR